MRTGGSFLTVKRSWGMTLTTHPHLVLISMSRSYTFFALGAHMRDSCTLHFLLAWVHYSGTKQDIYIYIYIYIYMYMKKTVLWDVETGGAVDDRESKLLWKASTGQHGAASQRNVIFILGTLRNRHRIYRMEAVRISETSAYFNETTRRCCHVHFNIILPYT
jgi:hypothetical protein